MRLTTTYNVVLLLGLVAAHPHHHDSHLTACQSTDADTIASEIACGEEVHVRRCIQYVGSDVARLEKCLRKKAGCDPEEAQAEASWAAELCQQVEEATVEDVSEEASVDQTFVIELREINRRDTTSSSASSTASETSTSTSSTGSSTSATSTTSTTSSTASSSSTSQSTTSTTLSTATATSTSESSTSSTSQSTTSTTSSTATATSSSDSSSNVTVSPAVSYLVAVLLALFAGGCAIFICYSCCTERRQHKARLRAAETKAALADMAS